MVVILKIKDLDSELLYFPFVVLAPIVSSILFLLGGYWKISLVIFTGHIIPVIMLFRENKKNQKKTNI